MKYNRLYWIEGHNCSCFCFSVSIITYHFVINVFSEAVTDESERNKMAVGAAGLLLGLVFFLTGLIYFRCKKNAAGKRPN